MSRRGVLLGCIAVVAMSSFSGALGQQEAEKPTQMLVRPAAAPVPALKYLLLPEHRMKTLGNAALLYHRAIEMMISRRARDGQGEKSASGGAKDWKGVADWVNGPIESIPRDRAKSLLESNRNALDEVELGARQSSCDWGFEQRPQTVDLLIEEIQQMRSVIWLVSLKARMAILEGKTDEATHWIQIGFVVARHVGEGPLVIQSLVGVSMCQVMCRALEDLIQAPGAPNLYWALAYRPRPFVDFTAGLESERFLLENEIPSLRELDGPPWSVERAREFSGELQRKLFRLADYADGADGSESRQWKNRLGMAAIVLQAYPEAKRALIAQGRRPEQVEAMPTVQVAALHTFQRYERFRDDFFKWTNLPFYQGHKGLNDSLASGRTSAASGDVLFRLFTMMIPAVASCGRAQALGERRLGAIQCIEAIRLHAALHGGKLPSSLEEITDAPVPSDAATGKPFNYKVDGDRAVISAPAPPGGPDHPLFRINYELKLSR